MFAEIYKENLNTYLHIEEDYKIDNLFEKHVLRKMKKLNQPLTGQKFNQHLVVLVFINMRT